MSQLSFEGDRIDAIKRLIHNKAEIKALLGKAVLTQEEVKFFMDQLK